MKLKLIACVATLAAASLGISHADTGTFGFGIELDGTGAHATSSGTTTLYALDSGGGTRLSPSNTAVLSTAWTSASTAASPTFSLGTFSRTDTLTLDGGSMLTDKNNNNSNGDVTGVTLEYAIVPTGGSATFTAVNLPFNQDNVSGNTGDQRWSLESGTLNLLAGLAPGTYELDVYGFASVTNGSTAGSVYESNSGNNFAASFTVVPEPSTWAMMLGGLGFLLSFQHLRRKQSL